MKVIYGALRREPFDQYFLNQIRTWRNMLGEDIRINNPEVDVETLNILFIEKGLALLNDDGMLGYIVPHKFMNIKSGAKLRELLAGNANVKKIWHFGTHQVFEDRSTYTCILVLSKQGNEEFQIGFIQDWNQFLFDHDSECITYPAAYISGQPWSFLPQNIVTHLEEIAPSCVALSSLVDIFVLLQRSTPT